MLYLTLDSVDRRLIQAIVYERTLKNSSEVNGSTADFGTVTTAIESPGELNISNE